MGIYESRDYAGVPVGIQTYAAKGSWGGLAFLKLIQMAHKAVAKGVFLYRCFRMLDSP